MLNPRARRPVLASLPAVTLLAALAVAPATAQTIVRPTTPDGDTVAVSPAAQVIAPGTLAARVEVANRTGGRVVLYPRVRDVSFDDTGAPVAERGASEAARHLRITERVTLDGGEAAAVHLRLDAVAAWPDVIAISFDDPASQTPGPTAWLVFAAADTPPPDVELAASSGDDLRAEALIEGVGVVDIGLRSSGWWGASATTTADALVVVGQRRVGATFETPAPGPYRIDATVVDHLGRGASSTVEVVRWDRLPLLLGAVLLLLATTVLAGRAARRRNRVAS